MSRIAILSDIHANLFALEAALEDAATQQLDELLVGGDLVGRGPQGSAVVERVIAGGWRAVRGNHEDYLLNFHHRRVPESWWHDPVWSASCWMSRELTQTALDFIDALPFSLHAERDAGLFLVHGTPRSNQEGIGLWTAPELLDLFAEQTEGDALACAHTHRPMHLSHQGVTLVNTGSVGLPFNGDWRAQYAILSRESREESWAVEFRQVEYDREAFLKHYETSGFLKEGGITSAMLVQEIRHARPFLVPYLRWAEALGKGLDAASIEEFLGIYDPHLSMSELVAFFAELGVSEP